MPYITPENRPKYNESADTVAEMVFTEYMCKGRMPVGHLNYVFTRILLNILLTTGTSYEHINALIGVLESCKLELYRKIAAPYEDEKEEQNGSIIGVH